MRSSLLVLVPVFALGGTAYAQSTTDKGLKIGYVDMARALNEVEDGKAAKAKLKADFDEKQKKLDKMQNDLKAKKDEFDKKAAMMNPEAKAQKQDELQRSFLELQRTYMELQKELSDREAQITAEIADKLRRVIASLGDRDGYNLIVNIGDTVLYYKRHQDMTDEVVREYNRQFAATNTGSKK
jgi:outer membrane protein